MKVWADGIDISDAVVFDDATGATPGSFSIVGFDPGILEPDTTFTVQWDASGTMTTFVGAIPHPSADEIIDRFARELAAKRPA